MIRASVVLAVAVLFLAGGAGSGAAGAGPGRIVFSSFLPEYPLPNNFQVDRTFVVGKSDRELAVDDVLSPDGSRLATVRGGTELWVSNVDGTKPQRVAAAAVPIATVIWSHDGSRLAFAAGSVWVVGADGADLHEVFAPSSVKIVLPRYGAWAP